MTFFICLLCLVAGIAIGVGFTQVVCTSMVNDTNKMWLTMLKEMDKIETQDVDEATMVYKNATVVSTPKPNGGSDVCWYRQPNTEEMTYGEWERERTYEELERKMTHEE